MLKRLCLVTILVNCIVSSLGNECRDSNAVPGCDKTCQKRCPYPKTECGPCPEENSCECKDGYSFDPVSYSCSKTCYDADNCSVEESCPEAIQRFTDAILRLTSKALKVFANSTCETGSIATITSMFSLASFLMYAEGGTKNEISRILDLFSNEEILCVTSHFNKEASTTASCIEFWAAPCIFANDRHPLTSAFKNIVDVITLDGLAENIDFSQSQRAGNKINQKLAQQTRNRILNAVPDSSSFYSSTELVTASALYFKFDWKIEFQETNKVTQFRKSPTESAPQIFQYQDAVYNYTYSEILGAEIVQVNLCVEELSLWLILPDCPFTEGAVIDKMAENLDWYNDTKEKMKPTRLDLYMPLYDKQTTADSAYILQKASGLETIFNNKTIQLRGVVEGDEQVAVSKGFQTTYIKCTFKGDPVPDGLPEGPKKTIIADYPHPFMFFGFGRVFLAGIVRGPAI